MTKLLKLRAAPAYLNIADPRIDRENLMIRDTVAMLADVEAIGHGIQSDQRTLDMMLTLSQGKSRGIKMHFGHTGMSENAMGRQIAWAKNFRIQGDKLLHDIDFMPQAAVSPAFGQDPIEYILQMAENQPEDIGESVVIECETVWTTDTGEEYDGDAKRPDNALTELPVIRPTKFIFVDVVADPALTRDGLLASAMFAGSSSFYSDQAFQLIDDFRSEYNITLEELPRKVQLVMGRYMQARGYKPGADMSKTIKRKFEEDGAEVGVVPGLLNEPEPAEAPAAPAAAEPAAPAPAQDQAASDVDDALQTAKSTEADLADDTESDAEPAETEGDTVPAEQYQAALNRIDELEAALEAQDKKLDKVIELATLNAKNNQALAAKVASLEGEPVVTTQIGGQRQFATPKLPDFTTVRKPTHVTSKVKAQGNQPVNAASDPALLSLAASAARSSSD